MIKIITISHGWFEMDINRQCILTNSGYLGCDAPQLFIKAFIDLQKENYAVRWLSWQDEPGLKILRIEKYDDKIIFEVYDSKKEAFNCAFEGDSLQKDIDKLIYSVKDSYKEVLRSVISEFYLYQNGNGNQRYKKHWGDFPYKEYDQLKNIYQTL